MSEIVKKLKELVLDQKAFGKDYVTVPMAELEEAIAALQPSSAEREEVAKALDMLADHEAGDGWPRRAALCRLGAKYLRTPVAVTVDDLNLLHAGDMSPAEQMAFADKLEAALAGEVG